MNLVIKLELYSENLLLFSLCNSRILLDLITKEDHDGKEVRKHRPKS